MLVVRRSNAIRVPVLLTTGAGVAATGVLAADVWDGSTPGQATIFRGDGTSTAIILSDGVNWIEVDAVKAPGLYHLVVPAVATAVLGGLQVVLLPAAAAFVAAYASVSVEEYHVASQIAKNNWSIETSGGDANRLVVFADDGVTALYKFDLKDAVGGATVQNPFSRERVPGF